VQRVRILDRDSRKAKRVRCLAHETRPTMWAGKSGKVDAIDDEGADSGTETATDGVPQLSSMTSLNDGKCSAKKIISFDSVGDDSGARDLSDGAQIL
jgi:hypothetical protein